METTVMKKLTILVAALIMSVGLVACGSDDDSAPDTTAPVSETTGSSGTTPTTEDLDGNEMGDNNDDTTEAEDGNEMGDNNGSGGVSTDTTEAQDGNQMGDDNNSGGVSPDTTEAQDGNQMGDQ